MYRAVGLWTFFLSVLWALVCRADQPSFYKDVEFMDGGRGTYPKHHFKTSIIEPPRMNFEEPFSKCDDGSYIFVAPRGNVVDQTFHILDHEYVLYVLMGRQ